MRILEPRWHLFILWNRRINVNPRDKQRESYPVQNRNNQTSPWDCPLDRPSLAPKVFFWEKNRIKLIFNVSDLTNNRYCVFWLFYCRFQYILNYLIYQAILHKGNKRKTWWVPFCSLYYCRHSAFFSLEVSSKAQFNPSIGGHIPFIFWIPCFFNRTSDEKRKSPSVLLTFRLFFIIMKSSNLEYWSNGEIEWIEELFLPCPPYQDFSRR